MFSLKAHTVDIKRITIITGRSGTDKILLETNLPAATYPFIGNASFTLDVAKADGVNYVSFYFPGVPTEVISEANKQERSNG